MDDSDVELTEEDWEAAREAFRHNPALREKAGTADPERRIAELHHLWGSSRFQLRFGLRKPTNLPEQWQVDMYRGQITQDEYEKRMSDYVHRPVDEQMLRKFFEEFTEQVARYGCFVRETGDLILNPRRHPVREVDEAVVDQLAAKMQAKLNLYGHEIQAVVEFLREARVAKQMGIVRIPEFSASTAADLVFQICHYAAESWKSRRQLADRSQRTSRHGNLLAIDLFANTAYPSLPRPQELLTLLDEEYALAKLYLREQSTVPKTRPDNVDSHSHAELSRVQTPRISVPRWTDLAIGIDEHGRYWAVTPPPSPGQVFKMSHAIEVTLPGKRWEVVLKEFSKETENGQVRRDDLCRLLGYMSSSTTLKSDPRAHPGAEEIGQIEELRVRQKIAIKSLNIALADLRRELRKFVDCPKKGTPNCIRTDGAIIHSEFIVRYLMRDESERLIFGKPRD